MDPDVDNTLIPVLRQAVDVFKMILFKTLKADLAALHAEAPPAHIVQLAGATLNALFGIVNDAEPHASFAQSHDADIEKALSGIAATHADLREPLTDALRIQFLCDFEEGIDSQHILTRAANLGLLVADRETPLPKTFMHLARVLGIAHGVLDPATGPQAPDSN